MIKTKLCDMLGIEYPIIQAGMGPLKTVDLAAAVSNAGGMGTVSIPNAIDAQIAARTIIEHLHEVARKTDKNFAVNTPIASQKTSPKEVLEAHDAMIRAIVQEKKRDPELRKRLILHITSGGDPTHHHKMIKDAGLLHFHMVASVRHAELVEKLGLDGIIASGYEMGGHTHFPGRAIHTFILVPSVAQAVKIPVIASGGICDGATFAAALALGAVGIQMGTRFIATKECDFHENYKQFIVDSGEYSDMVVPSMLSLLRVLKNQTAYKIIEAEEKVHKGEMSLLKKAELVEGSLRRAEEVGDIVDGLVSAGQVSSRIKEIKTVQKLLNDMVEEGSRIIKDLNKLIAK